jgi:hypothetical protein
LQSYRDPMKLLDPVECRRAIDEINALGIVLGLLGCLAHP